MRNGLLGKDLGDFSTLRPACRAERRPDPAGAGADRGVGNEMHPPTPPGFCMDVKGKGLRENGFVSVGKYKDLQIDRGGRGICKCMKRKGRRKWVVDGG